MMPKNAMIVLVDRYLPLFKQRQDVFSINAVKLLAALKKELNGDSPAMDQFYTGLGFHYWLNFFDSITITNDNFASCILMQKFINEVKKSPLDTEITALFQRFNTEALAPALKEYQEKLTSPSVRELQAIYDGLMLCLTSHLQNRKVQIASKVRAEFVEHNENQVLLVQHLLFALINNTDLAKDMMQENKDLLVVAKFMIQYAEVLKKEQGQIKTWDLLSLKRAAEDAREQIAQMPEMKEVQQYNWLINLLCNFINKYIVECFESQQQKEVNRFFKRWERELDKADEINRNISNSEQGNSP